MKQMKVIGAMFGLLLLANSAVQAKDASGGMDQRAQNMAAAMDSLTQTISNGSSEDVAGASDSVLAKVSDFGRAEDEASVVQAGVGAGAAPLMSSLTASDSKSSTLFADGTPTIECRQICASWGQFHICIQWVTVCTKK